MARDLVTDNESWLDYAEGAMMTILGVLEAVSYGMPGGLILRFADWTTFIVETDRPREVTHPIGTLVYVRAKRTEDGVHATAIWAQGGAPIPLVGGAS